MGLPILGFTGSRSGLTALQEDRLRHYLREWEPDLIVHGGCRGADTEFHELAMNLSGTVLASVYPSRESQLANFEGRDRTSVNLIRPPLDRNHTIVEVCDWLIACPRQIDEVLRSGTWATIRYARTDKRNHVLIFHTGNWSEQHYA